MPAALIMMGTVASQRVAVTPRATNRFQQRPSQASLMPVQAGSRPSVLSTFVWFFLLVNGRIGRQEFSLGFFGLMLADMLVIRIGSKLDSEPRYYTNSPPDDDISILRMLLIASLWPFAAIIVKRLHDLNVSGWWALAILGVPHLAAALHVKYWIPYLAIVATLSVLPGSKGDNRFGRDPLARAGI
ncbi:DUF805 domain-containing protein [Bradyrhizobium sp. WSM 1704]|uniref:DUF805 domain-containing protein n=1 Tax=Bradyrhizobium semiaridum TaxID=2821404 RepID=UPI001CE31B1C|nr:DUF805 domain-containing protein [Bradyrhizobium semiaridum]MCA6121642.1 DUF805 domain-containing protein [Bradyrhizobium semiaridum]